MLLAGIGLKILEKESINYTPVMNNLVKRFLYRILYYRRQFYIHIK
jgi:hypothetical protein